MRIVILTSSLSGLAPLCLASLVKAPEVEIAMVVYSEGQALDQWKERRRKFKKVLKIGLLGALNGVRMRPWFNEHVVRRLSVERLDILADRFDIRLERTPGINCQRTIDLFAEAGAELGLSLGNGYIGQRVFSIPKYGMINIHHEVLPQFQGAQSVIWQIYEGSLETGYTIHQIDRRIDTGPILYQEKRFLELRPTLQETVSHNCARLYRASAAGLVKVLSNYSTFAANAQPQVGGRSFTTPTIWQYLRMIRQHRRLYREYQARI